MSGAWVMFTLVVISSVPVISVYVWYRLAKYSFSYIRFFLALLAGAAAVFPALLLQGLMDLQVPLGGRMGLFYDFFVRIAFTEESCRLLIMFFFFWMSGRITKDSPGLDPSWGEVKKGAATGLVAGLGFSILESAAYAASSSNPGVILLRAVTAAPLHGACGSRVGMCAVTFRSNPFQSVMRLLTAVAIHGIYNFMILLPGLPSIAAILIALSAFASSVLIVKGSWTAEKPTDDD
jgi:RsiW-degrading membrane proteinase PrsW (M82 family)